MCSLNTVQKRERVSEKWLPCSRKAREPVLESLKFERSSKIWSSNNFSSFPIRESRTSLSLQELFTSCTFFTHFNSIDHLLVHLKLRFFTVFRRNDTRTLKLICVCCESQLVTQNLCEDFSLRNAFDWNIRENILEVFQADDHSWKYFHNILFIGGSSLGSGFSSFRLKSFKWKPWNLHDKLSIVTIVSLHLGGITFLEPFKLSKVPKTPELINCLHEKCDFFGASTTFSLFGKVSLG